MKKVLLFLFALAMYACGTKSTGVEDTSIPADILMMHTIRAVMDSNVSCLDYQDEIMMFMDTLKKHAEYYPDANIRIGAKSFAMNLLGLFLYGGFTKPEENRFFEDSLILRLAEIQHIWYIPANVLLKNFADHYTEPVLEQTLVLRYNDENHVIFMALYFLPNNNEVLVITLPTEASYLASICFYDEQLDKIDTTATFNLTNALNVQEAEDEFGQMITYNKKLIDAMLSHQGMFIAYIGDEEGDDIRDRWHDAHLDLKPFHRQYQQVKELMKVQK